MNTCHKNSLDVDKENKKIIEIVRTMTLELNVDEGEETQKNDLKVIILKNKFFSLYFNKPKMLKQYLLILNERFLLYFHKFFY